MMSKNVFLVMVLFAASCTFAGYTYVIEDGDDIVGLSLNNEESLLMTGGQVYHLTMNESNTARIEGTDPLISEHIGGIWFIAMGSYTSLDILCGDIHEIAITSDSLAFISGGRIDQIWSQQHVNPDPHITIDCKDWEHDIDTNILTGTWFDFTTFEIQLIDVDGFDPAIENIQFIPEPMSLMLLGIGAIIVRKRRV